MFGKAALCLKIFTSYQKTATKTGVDQESDHLTLLTKSYGEHHKKSGFNIDGNKIFVYYLSTFFVKIFKYFSFFYH